MAERERLIARYDAGLMTVGEARAAYRPWRMLIRDLGMEEIT